VGCGAVGGLKAWYWRASPLFDQFSIGGTIRLADEPRRLQLAEDIEAYDLRIQVIRQRVVDCPGSSSPPSLLDSCIQQAFSELRE
jgi:hypothetical protein